VDASPCRGFVSPYNSETQVWLVIEDEEEANATYRRMLEDGVTVVDELPDR
jgi:uncharacterized glyoxalase superfamily protein PhnB